MFDQFINLMVNNEAWFYTFVFAFSLMVGSFLNVVIHRLPLMMEKEWLCECKEILKDQLKPQADSEKAQEEQTYNLVVPRSACPKCGHQITALENIPVISYLFLRGKCANCANPISIRYPLVELLTATASVVVAMVTGPQLITLCYIALTWAIIALAFIDFDSMFLPDEITLPLIWAGLVASVVGISIAPTEAIIGACAGYLSLWSVYWLFKTITKKEGMGYGDFKLMAAFGAWLGWQQVILIVFLSSFVGAIFSIAILIIQNKGKNTQIPFGPYIAIAGWIALLWGNEITQFYLNNYFAAN